MDPKQILVLNSLVTFAVETIPGGPSEKELEVAKIVGTWALASGIRTHNYTVINTSHHNTIAEAANSWADRGWRVVAAIGARGAGYATALILERPVGISHPDD